MSMIPIARFVGPAALAFFFAVLVARSGEAAQHDLLPHPDNPSKKVEVYWRKPAGPGPFPVIVFIHGHQPGRRADRRPGGKVFVSRGRFERMVAGGYVAAAVSQPGYGGSDGPPDFCGPFTHKAVLAALAFLRAKSFVKADKIALFGYSRGAIVAGMVAAKDPRLAAVILVAGMYNIEKDYPTGLTGLDDNLRRETKGASKAALRARSAFHHAEKIKAPVLLLHGANDDRAGPESARRLADMLRKGGTTVQLNVFPRVGHSIPPRLIIQKLDQFLSRHVGPLRVPSGRRFREKTGPAAREGPLKDSPKPREDTVK